MLKGMDRLIEEEIGVKTMTIDDPLTCVARGAGIAAENPEAHFHLFNSPLKPLDISL